MLCRHDAHMRTTLNIDDDVLSEARALAAQKKTSLGKALSELMRRGIKRRPNDKNNQDRPGFDVARDAEPITSEDVYRALNDWP